MNESLPPGGISSYVVIGKVGFTMVEYYGPSKEILLIRHLDDYVSTESYSVSMEGLKDVLKGVVPDITRFFGEFAKIFSKKKDSIAIKLNPKLFKHLDTLHDKCYVDIRNEVIVIPPHLGVTYIEIVKLLAKMSEYVGKVDERVKQFYQDTGIIASSKEVKDSLDTKVLLYNQWKAEREKYKDEIASCYTGKDPSPYAKLSDVIRRRHEILEMKDCFETIKVNTGGMDLNGIKTKLERTHAQLQAILTNIVSGQYASSDKNLARTLSLGALEIAEQCELIAFYQYQLMMIENSLLQTVEKFEQDVTGCKQ